MTIALTINAAATAAGSSISSTGNDQHIISDSERNTFNIQDGNLKQAINTTFGKAPNDAYLHSPTPWNDLYTTYGWPQVQTTLSVQSATVIGFSSQATILSTKVFTNNSSHDATFNTGITDSVTNTAESNWTNANTVTASQTISYGINFLGTGGGGQSQFSYSRTWGKGGSESQAVTVGSESGVQVTLKPGESVKAVLSASRGELTVRVVYQATLSGMAAVNYNPTFKGHHFWGLDINGVLGGASLPQVVTITEDIKIGYYADAVITLEDGNGKTLMATPAAAQPGVTPEPALAHD